MTGWYVLCPIVYDHRSYFPVGSQWSTLGRRRSSSVLCVQNRVHYSLYDGYKWAGTAHHRPNVRTLYKLISSLTDPFDQHRLREEEGEAGSG